MKQTRYVPIVLVALLGCRSAAESSTAPPATTTAAQAGAASAAVAQMDGATITQAELDDSVGDKLVALRQQEYDVRRQGLDELIGDKLIEREAARRGVSRDELQKLEVDSKTARPSETEMAAWFQTNRQRLGGRTYEQIKPELEFEFTRRNSEQRRQAFVKDLRQKANVRVSLQPPRFDLKLPASAPVLGATQAPVTLVEFADYQCPYCMRAEATVDQVMKTYGAKVRFVHGDLPLESHAQAFSAARAARCAGEQGRFWEYRRNLLVEQGDFLEADLLKRAKSFSLDTTAFQSCIASDRHDAAIREGLAAATRVGVASTPTFFINGRMLVGARAFEDFAAIIDEELTSFAK